MEAFNYLVNNIDLLDEKKNKKLTSENEEQLEP